MNIGSLALSKNFVVDAFAVGAATFYKPEDIVLGQYGFVPWVRAGLSAAIQPPTGADLRGIVHVTAEVTASDGSQPALPIDKTLILRGPGDVVGLDPAQIVRREPNNGTLRAEDTFLVHIEFDRPELPWLFSPFAPTGDVLKPWLALIVCEADKVLVMPSPPGLPMQMMTMLGELQSLVDAPSWAHAQVVGATTAAGGGGLDPAGVADRLSDEHAPANLSRIICPRKLDPETQYIACLVPAFDAGVKAGLGSTEAGTLDPAWRRAADGSDRAIQIVLPVYDNWTFSTGAAGDFLSLAERLQGVKAPWSIGRRIIDTRQPGAGLIAAADDSEGAVQVLKCALYSPQSPPADAPSENSTWAPARREALRLLVDAANEAANADLPRVGPRLYARFQRGAARIGPVFGTPATDASSADASWFPQLNTNPLDRVVAGLGTRVVNMDQEPLMQAAWAQVGEIRKVNTALARHQLGRYAAEALHTQHFAKLDLGTLAQVMRGVHGKVKVQGDPLTVYGKVDASQVAPVAMTAAYRRLTRQRGPLSRFKGATGAKALNQLVAVAEKFRDMRRIYVNPDGISGLSDSGIRAIPAALIARTLGLDAAVAYATLGSKVASLERNPSVADKVLTPVGNWRIPAGNIDLSALVAQQVADQVTAAAGPDITKDSIKAEALGALLVGLANSGVAAVAQSATTQVKSIDQKLPRSVIINTATNTSTPGLGAVNAPSTTVLRTLSGATTVRPSIAGVRTVTTARPAIVSRNAAATSFGVNVGAAVGGTRTAPNAGAAAAVSPTARFETATSRALTGDLVKVKGSKMIDVAAAVAGVAITTGVVQLPLTPDRPALGIARTALLTAVQPSRTMTDYVKGRLAVVPSWLSPDWFADGRIAPIMAAPHFDRPMYEALDAYDRDWLVPGIGDVGLTDFVTLLNTNAAFTETFLVGLSDEMGRELLWRGYPTDQRGTYFKRFWDADEDELTTDIHRFSAQPLGAHIRIGGTSAGVGQNNLAFVIRGEIVRRYPNAIIAAVLAETDDDQPPTFSVHTAPLLFQANLDPDFLLVGFKLTEVEVRAQPWWFIIAEHPTAPRFGLAEVTDADNPRAAGSAIAHNMIDWNDLTDASAQLEYSRFLTPRARSIMITDTLSMPGNVGWPGSSAAIARTLLRNPSRAAFRGKDLIDQVQAAGGLNA